ncbi:ribosome-inactivating family protein [Streptomyces sp. NPDC051987]|uniref:ribosome-inactivating family protein n=1 Tax=Streptomyces sp. NPDC051987 TaxID=3155808 RepID=UPI0034468F0B
MSRAHIFRRLSTSAVLSAALAGAVALAGLGGNLTTGAQHQKLGGHVELAADTYPSDGMSFEMTDVDADQYDSIISFLRERSQSWRLYNNIVLTRTSDDYFPLTLRVGGSQITLIINARNLYVTGWQNDNTGVYYRLGAGPAELQGQNGRTEERKWLNYTQLEQQAGVDRGSLGITMGAIQGSISDLARSNSQDQARALLVLIQAFSEGARYDFISYRVGQAMRNHSTFYAGSQSWVNGGSGAVYLSALDLENNWAGLSQAVENSTHNGYPVDYQIGNGHFTSMQAIDEQLAMALYLKM